MNMFYLHRVFSLHKTFSLHNAHSLHKALAILVILASSQAFSAAYIDQQVNTLIPVFEKGNISQVKSAADKLGYAGISDPKLYDVIEARLMGGYMGSEKFQLEMTGWLIKALSYSGNSKYAPSLQKILDSNPPRKVIRYAKSGLETLDRYSKINPDINKGLGNLTGEAAKARQVENMLQSSNYELVRMGARRVVSRYSTNKKLLAKVEKRLLADYQASNNDKMYIDAMAWLCKALGASGDSAYQATLQKVESGASSRKVQKYARKYSASY